MFLSFGFPVRVSQTAITQAMQISGMSPTQAESWVNDQVTRRNRTVLVPENKYGGYDTGHVVVSSDMARFETSLAWEQDHPVLIVHRLVPGSSQDAAWMLRVREQRAFSRIALDSVGAWHWCGPLLQPLPVCDFYQGHLARWSITGKDLYLVACPTCCAAQQQWLSRRGLAPREKQVVASLVGAR